MSENRSSKTFILILLTMVYAFSFIDRQILGILVPFVQKELELTNTQIGFLLGPAFAIIYTITAIPIAWLADRVSRINILTIALATWSGFTALTGFAGNYTQIAIARMGVGVGEAGGSPPAHSMISDLYPKEKRASALAVYSLGIPLGVMFAFLISASLLGKQGDEVNWRRIFIILGLVGVGLAVLMRMLIREPERGAMEVKTVVNSDPFLTSLGRLLKIPSWWAMCLGISMGSFVAYSFAGFQTKYLFALDPDLNFKNLLIVLGLINGVAYSLGTYFGARITDAWGKKNIRAYGWVPAIAMAFALPLAIGAYHAGSVNQHLAYIFVFLLFLGVYLGPSFAIAQTLAPIHMRALSTALYFFILNTIAMAGGPFLSGVLIDRLLKTNDELHAIRLAMSGVSLAFGAAVICFLFVAWRIPKDWADAEKRNEAVATN
jgi:MFS family permease